MLAAVSRADWFVLVASIVSVAVLGGRLVCRADSSQNNGTQPSHGVMGSLGP